MKFLLESLLTAFVLVVLVSGHVVNDTVAGHVIVEEPAKYLLQLSPDTQQWVTEEEKWEFIRVRLSKQPCPMHGLASAAPVFHCSQFFAV